jgi:6-phosphogluconate dehydrogenase
MVIKLAIAGHRVVAYDVSPQAVVAVAFPGVEGASGMSELVAALTPPRTIWVMVPAGKPVDEVFFNGLLPHLAAGDLLVDGGNSNYKDSVRRAQELREKGIDLLDVGTSGGLEGAEQGLSFMVGGPKAAFKRLEPVLRSLAAPSGYGHVGPSGAGNFVKTVHNGVEYALLQSYAEGFEVLREGPYELDLGQVAGIWNNGGVVRSWLLGLAQRILEKDAGIKGLAAEVGGGETGRWAIEAAMDAGVPFATLAVALSQRYHSRRKSFAARLVAALRREFGGHPVSPSKE